MPSDLNLKNVIKLLEKDKEYILSCSGGIDSMVLFDILLQHRIPFRVVHINYALRGTDSDADEQFVADTCRQSGIQFEGRRMPIIKGKNIQLEARRLRYEWYQSLTQETNSKVLLAHHRDDQVETFYMNLMRKSGLVGLSGMPSEHNGIIRPLLNETKQDIQKYALRRNLKWREDSSNDSLYYVRNSWRNEYLPLIEKEIPTIRSSVMDLIKCFQQNLNEVRERTIPIYYKLLKDASISLNDYVDMDADSRFELARLLGQNQRWMNGFERLKQRGSQLMLRQPAPFNFVLKDKVKYVFIRNEPKQQELLVEPVSQLPNEFDHNFLYVDADKIHGHLTLRRPARGERMKPVGMQGSRLISAILKDSRLNQFERKSLMVLSDEQHVLWIPGIKVSRNALATKDSKNILRIRVISIED